MHNVYVNYIVEYHDKIERGQIIAGKWIKKIYEIIINGLQKQEYFFNAKAVKEHKIFYFLYALTALPFSPVN